MDRSIINGEKVSSSYVTCIIKRKNIEIGIFNEKKGQHVFKLLKSVANSCSIEGRLFNADALKCLVSSYVIKTPLLIALEGNELREHIGPAGDLVLNDDLVVQRVPLGNGLYYYFMCPCYVSLQYTLWALHHEYQLLICTTIHRACVEVWLHNKIIPKDLKQLVDDSAHPYAAHYGLFMLRDCYE